VIEIAQRVIPQPAMGIYRRLIPQPLRQKLHQKFRKHILKLPASAANHFRTMVSATSPVDPIPGRVVITCGSLRARGAERRVANTLVGLSGREHQDQSQFSPVQ
jgi:hypothetical protein